MLSAADYPFDLPFAKPLDITSRDALTEGLSTIVDININLGQNKDADFLDHGAGAILPFVSSVNVPCGVHDGHPLTINKALSKIKTNQCALGAQIGLPPGVAFDSLSEEDLMIWVRLQLGALGGLAQGHDLEIAHIRPHGALYDAFFTNPDALMPLAKVLLAINPWLILVGPACEGLQVIQKETGLRVAGEIHIGCRYTDAGRPLNQANETPMAFKTTLEQVHQLIREKALTSTTGKRLPMVYHSLHLTPGTDQVLDVARSLAQRIQRPVPLPLTLATSSGWV
jgi:UPF0271 protein